MRRILFPLIAVLVLAACESATAPTSGPRSASAAARNLAPNAVENSHCESGWSVPDGRCL